MENKENVQTSFYDRGIRNSHLTIYSIVTSILAIIVVVVIIVITYKYQLEMSKERGRYLAQITEKTSEIANIDIANRWNYTKPIYNVALRANVETDKELMAALNEALMRSGITYNVYAAFDNNGNVYYSNGKKDCWDNNKEFFMEAKEDNKVFIDNLKNINIEQPQIVFVKKMPKELKLKNGIVINYVGLIQPVERFAKKLDVENKENPYVMQMIDKKGNILYSHNKIKNIPDKENIDGVLKKSKFLDNGSLKEYRKIIKERKIISTKFAYKNEQYYLSYAPIDIEDWGVLHVLHVDSVNSETERYLSFAIYSIVAIAICISVLIVISIYMMLKLKHNHYMIKVQKETNKVLKRAADEANYANKAKSNFLAHMSHDIRTPINGIVGMTHIAKRNIDDKEKVNDYLNKIEISSRYLMSLINDVLDMSRIEKGKIAIKQEPLNLKDLYEKCKLMIDQQTKEHNIELKGSLENVKHINVLGDELHLKQVLINVLGNAVKFTPDGGEIIFTIEEFEDDGKEGKYRFIIADNGIGMSEEYQEHIFESFSQEDEGSRTSYKGTGLGMAIVKSNLDLMNGTISINSKLDEGSTFIIDINMKITNNIEENENVDLNVNFKGKKILVAEDNELNMEIITTMLEMDGLEVVQAWDGKQALDIFSNSKENEYTVILMDIMMPEMDGLEATKKIRKLKRKDATDVKIIAMTANAYEEDERKTSAAGMNKHLTKPIEYDKLITVLYDLYSE